MKQFEGIVTGLIGSPIAHSKSPLIHHTWLKSHGLPGVYAPFEVDGSSLDAALDVLGSIGVKGLNVTAPLKTAAAERSASLSARAKRVGAVNTLTWTSAGWDGDLTDGEGFLASLAEAAAWRPDGAHAVIFGSGGAAAAVVDAALEGEAGKVVICNRTTSKAASLAERFGSRVEVGSWPPAPGDLFGASLLVNATSTGLDGEDSLRSLWASLSVDASALATDLTYHPLQTTFLEAMARRGLRTVDGLGMLLHQARPAFRRWHGVDPQVTDALRNAVLQTDGQLP